MHNYDCVIVGGGMVGATLALVLGQLQYRVLLLEQSPVKQPSPISDARTIALSYASVKIYSQLGLWDKLSQVAVPIEQVLVTVQQQFGSCWLRAKDEHVAALGYVVSMQDLEATLYQALPALETVTVLRQALLSHQPIENGWQLRMEDKTVTAGLLVAADGVGSKLAQSQGIGFHQKNYQHHAIMANVKFAATYPNTAIERFLKSGAIALLPYQDGYATCVWTVEGAADHFMALTDQDFLQQCQTQLGHRSGQLTAIGKRFCIPLNMLLANVQATHRFLLIGNAAHSLHPIAAQGFNLSLRDIWQLRQQLMITQAQDLGSAIFLDQYLNARKGDQGRVIFATDKLARFMTGGPLPSFIRSFGITMFDVLTPFKHKFSQLSMGI